MTRDTVLNAATVVAMLGAAWFALSDRAVATPSTPSTREAIVLPDSLWRRLRGSGHLVGPANAAVVVVEFGDFQCPACAAAAGVIDSVLQRHPHDFAVAYHHLPLPYHKLAYPLARASECAAAQGRFPQFFQAAFRNQEKMGVINVVELGRMAGVADSGRFAACVRDTMPVSVVDADAALARRLEVPATPAIFVNGRLQTRSLSASEYERLLADTRKAGAN